MAIEFIDHFTIVIHFKTYYSILWIIIFPALYLIYLCFMRGFSSQPRLMTRNPNCVAALRSLMGLLGLDLHNLHAFRGRWRSTQGLLRHDIAWPWVHLTSRLSNEFVADRICVSTRDRANVHHFDFPDVSHLQPLAATCSVSHLQPLAAAWQPLAATCSHSKPLAPSATCNPLRPLGSHLPRQPLAPSATCHLQPLGSHLAATCSHLQPLAPSATCSHLQPLGSHLADTCSSGCSKWLPSGCKWLTSQKSNCAPPAPTMVSTLN